MSSSTIFSDVNAQSIVWMNAELIWIICRKKVTYGTLHFTFLLKYSLNDTKIINDIIAPT